MSVWQVETYRPGTANSLVCYRGTDETVARETYDVVRRAFLENRIRDHAVMLRENGEAIRSSRDEKENV